MKSKGKNAWKPRSGVDEYAAPFGGSMNSKGRVKRAGDRKDVKRASRESGR